MNLNTMVSPAALIRTLMFCLGTWIQIHRKRDVRFSSASYIYIMTSARDIRSHVTVSTTFLPEIWNNNQSSVRFSSSQKLHYSHTESVLVMHPSSCQQQCLTNITFCCYNYLVLRTMTTKHKHVKESQCKTPVVCFS